MLEAQLDSALASSSPQAEVVRNAALLHYLSTLASSNEMGDTFDYQFVKSLLDSGADVNTPDKNGQTILHEVARSWDTDIVEFLLENGRFYYKSISTHHDTTSCTHLYIQGVSKKR